MNQLNDILFDLDFLAERAKRKLLNLQCKRLSHSANSTSSLDYIVTNANNDNNMFRMRNNIIEDNNTYDIDMSQKCTLKDFKSYFKVLRELSIYKE